MKLRELCEDATLYKFYEIDEDGRRIFVTNSTNLDVTIPTMQKHAKRTGNVIDVVANGTNVGQITASGYHETVK